MKNNTARKKILALVYVGTDYYSPYTVYSWLLVESKDMAKAKKLRRPGWKPFWPWDDFRHYGGIELHHSFRHGQGGEVVLSAFVTDAPTSDIGHSEGLMSFSACKEFIINSLNTDLYHFGFVDVVEDGNVFLLMETDFDKVSEDSITAEKWTK